MTNHNGQSMAIITTTTIIMVFIVITLVIIFLSPQLATYVEEGSGHQKNAIRLIKLSNPPPDCGNQTTVEMNRLEKMYR